MLVGAALTAFAAGLVVAGGDAPERAAAQSFAEAWARGDHVAMYAKLTPDARAQVSLRRFRRSYRDAADVLTLTGVHAGRVGAPEDGVVAVPVRLSTRIFGDLRGRLELPVERIEDGGAGVAWHSGHVFPGLRPGQKLERETELAPRATIAARDGTPIAAGAARLSELGPLASEIAGRIGPAPPQRAAELRRRGVPSGAPVGLTGLEREFDARLAGTPGGTLRAGGRVVAETQPRPGATVITSIDPQVQRAAVEALAGRFGGIAVIRPDGGEVLALAGIAYSAPQPPGSIFKIVTLAGALDAGVVMRSSRYPVETSATLEGVELANAHGEACGGSLRESFAQSCNSVFAPIGAKLGAKRLVEAAERFGFNRSPGLAGAARSTLPDAAEIGDDLAVGSTAIGQGKVLATPLLMAEIAGAIGRGGVRSRPTLLRGGDPERVRATSERSARAVARYMRSVVTSGTGVAAALPGVKVAGKTGTAELRDTTNDDPVPGPTADPSQPPPPVEDTTDTDAWFAGFAPLEKPRVAVAVLLVGQGSGGETAAPVAGKVIRAALRRRG